LFSATRRYGVWYALLFEGIMRNKKLIILFSILAFVTLLVVLSSVIFSVQNVYASCYNDDNEQLDGIIASKEVNGISRGKSMFMLSEKKVIAEIEKNRSDVRVVNIERKFPNQVYINYVRIFEYLAFETDSSVLYASNECKILSVGEKLDSYPDHIKLIAAGSYNAYETGSPLFPESSDEFALVNGIMDTVERMDLHSVVVDMFEFIDVSFAVGESVPCAFIKTRTGTYFELQGGAEHIAEKIRLAVSVYLSNETKYMNGGTIIVNSSGSKASYTKENRYELRIDE